MRIKWNDSLDKILFDNLEIKTLDELASLIGCTKSAVENRLRKLGKTINPNRTATDFIPLSGEKLFPIDGFKNFHISNYGRIKNIKTGKEIKSWVNTKSGYVCSMLCEDGRKQNVRVHILVAKAFHANPHNKATVNHKDGNKLNNHSTNVEWNTQSENQLHAFKTGLQVNAKGVDSLLSKATVDVVKQIAKLLKQGKNTTEIKQLVDLSNFNSPNSFISRIRNKKSYTEITKDIL